MMLESAVAFHNVRLLTQEVKFLEQGNPEMRETFYFNQMNNQLSNPGFVKVLEDAWVERHEAGFRKEDAEQKQKEEAEKREKEAAERKRKLMDGVLDEALDDSGVAFCRKSCLQVEKFH